MGQQNTYTIDDKATARVCSLAGLQLATKSLTTFQELKSGLDQSLKALERRGRVDTFMANSLVILRFTKASCDAFISLAADLTPGGSKINNMYGLGSVAADIVGTIGAGSKVDVVKSSADGAKAVAAFVPGNAGYFGKNGAVKTKVVVGALNGDIEEVKKSAVEYIVDLSVYTLESLSASQAKSFVEFGKTLFDYHQAVGETFEEYFENVEASRDRVVSGGALLRRQSGQMSIKIDELIAFMESCSATMSEKRVTVAASVSPQNG